jgi:hypothetical protein
MPLRYESAIRERLAAQVEGLKGVFGLPALGAEQARPAPCVYVLFNGLRVDQTFMAHEKARVDVSWQIVLAVRNLTDTADGAAARASAQTLAQSICSALMGWSPDPTNATPMQLVDSPAPVYDTGSVLLPFNFTTNYWL